MTVHLISVGINILEALEKRTKLPLDLRPHILREQPHAVLSSRVSDRAAADVQLVGWLSGGERQKLARLVEAVHVDRWPSSVSAELDTFDRAAHSRTLARNDIAVLLATDTVDGLTAALWNAVALVGGDLSRVRYLGSPREPLGEVRNAAVIVRVPGMDARSEADFRTAMGGLGALGRALCPPATTEGEDFRIYLSGGFKAAIPYLIGLAEGLRSLLRSSVEAFVLFEGANSHPIRLPLRRISKDAVVAELSGFDPQGVTRLKPHGNLLEGYAYDDDPEARQWELTAFGHGLRELFGQFPVDVGG